MTILLHITDRETWNAALATGSYEAASLKTEGFIHCSTPAQLLNVANTLFRGQTGLVLLFIDARRVQAEIRYEDCYATGQQFPHIYGPLKLEAVIRVTDFPPQDDGTFALPPEI